MKIVKLKAIVCVLMIMGMIGTVQAADVAKSDIDKGKQLAFDRKKGNCLACHYINDPKATMTGTIGPPLIAMKARYPDDKKLFQKIHDGVEGTMMPPFGKHQILSAEEIRLITTYIKSL